MGMFMIHATHVGKPINPPVVKSELMPAFGGGEAIAFLAAHGRLQIAINFWSFKGADNVNLNAVIGFPSTPLEGTTGTISKCSILGSGGPQFGEAVLLLPPF